MKIAAFFSFCAACLLWIVPAPYGPSFWHGVLPPVVLLIGGIAFARKQIVKEFGRIIILAMGASWVNLFVMLITWQQLGHSGADDLTWLLGLLAAIPAASYLLALAAFVLACKNGQSTES